jgi:8-oxo-dGTP diphosphatase
MAREFSAGGVVLRQMEGHWQLAAIHPRRDKATPKQKQVLALPKGIVDPGEKPEFTAAREVHEETGVRARLVGKLGDVKYVYVRSYPGGDGERVFKIVSFYLFEYESGRLGDISAEMRHEVEGAEWLPLDEAPRRLSYKGEREMARKALEYLAANPGLRVTG